MPRMLYRLAAIVVFTCTASVAGQSVAAPTIQPGTGWDETKLVAAPIGDEKMAGYQATAIARWDVVPHQTFAGKFEIGVIAFHINGIDRVEFAVEGGPWTAVRQMTLNPRTQTYEYWATLDASTFAESQEGEIQVKAVVYPKTAGRPRVLANGSETQVDKGDGSLTLVVDKGKLPHPVVWVSEDGNDDTADGSETAPFRTIDAAIKTKFAPKARPWDADKSGVLDGAIVWLKEGTHAGPKHGYYDMKRWVTISGAPGTDPNKVVIDSGGRPNIQLLRFTKLTWQPPTPRHLVHPNQKGRVVWFDQMAAVGGDRKTFGTPMTNQAETWFTNCTIDNFTEGVEGWGGPVWLARHVKVTRIAEDSFRVNTMIVNCTTHDVNKEGSNAHPDVVQTSAGEKKNVIIFGLVATDVRSQGIYIRGVDWAIVNVFIEQTPEWKFLWQVDKIERVQHCLIWHVGTVNQDLAWRTGDGTRNCRDVSIRNSFLTNMWAGRSSEGQDTDSAFLADNAITVDNSHFIKGSFVKDAKSTTGELPFVDSKARDFRPAPGSPLLGRVTELLVPCDATNRPRTAPSAIGPFESP